MYIFKKKIKNKARKVLMRISIVPMEIMKRMMDSMRIHLLRFLEAYTKMIVKNQDLGLYTKIQMKI